MRANRIVLACIASLLVALTLWSSCSDRDGALPSRGETELEGKAAPHGTTPLEPDQRTSTSPSRGATKSDPDPRDPERAPRAFLVVDFQTRSGPIEAERIEGLVLSSRGLELAPAPASASRSRRIGRFVSAPIPLDFAANAISPLYRAEIPEGADLSLEISLSQDGIDFSRWFDAAIDADSVGQIQPFYPDGRPNPNYGYMPCGILSADLERWKFVRYRISLSSTSTSAESPALSVLRFFYQDTTL